MRTGLRATVALAGSRGRSRADGLCCSDSPCQRATVEVAARRRGPMMGAHAVVVLAAVVLMIVAAAASPVAAQSDLTVAGAGATPVGADQPLSANDGAEAPAGERSSSDEGSTAGAGEAVDAAEEDRVRNRKQFAMTCLLCVDYEDLRSEHREDIQDAYYETADVEEYVFLEGVRRDKWDTCHTSNDSAEALSSRDCYVEDKYTDIAIFVVQYGLASLHEIQAPTVEVVRGGSARPKVEFNNEEADYVASITVEYNCSPADDDVNALRLRMRIAKDEEVSMEWLKVCGRGENKLVQISMLDAYENPIRLPLTASADEAGTADHAGLLTVPSDDASSTVQMVLLAPAKSQRYSSPPLVKSSDTSIVQTSVRGEGATGGRLSPDVTKFEVNYACHAAGVAEITLRIWVPPFDDIVNTWQKMCGVSLPARPGTEELGDGAGAEPAADAAAGEGADRDETTAAKLDPLDIGTSDGAANVMAQGAVSAAYTVAFGDAAGEHDGATLRELSEEETTVEFFVSNPASSTIAHHIDRVSVTQQPPGAMAAVVMEKASMLGRNRLLSTGGDIAPGETARLALHFICKRSASTRVLVTLASLHHQNVEFGFVKHCRKPIMIREASTFRTANSLLKLVSLLLIALGACLALLWRRHSARNERTGATDRKPATSRFQARNGKPRVVVT